MTKYRKKPVVIDARQWDGTFQGGDDILTWLTEEQATTSAEVKEGATTTFTIGTLEGAMSVSPGDYVIIGVHHEAYPCKPDVFEESYESVGVA